MDEVMDKRVRKLLSRTPNPPLRRVAEVSGVAVDDPRFEGVMEKLKGLRLEALQTPDGQPCASLPMLRSIYSNRGAAVFDPRLLPSNPEESDQF